MDAHRNGALAVVEALAAHGVTEVFGIPGTHNLELYRHLRTHGITAITPRHEQGAGYAADGYYLLSGKPGVVITTTGPGLTNVITAAATAYAESRPMLILSPGVPTGFERADVGMLHETKNSTGALEALLVKSQRTRTAEGASAAIAEAFALFASSRPGPVHIEIPLDVLEGPWRGTTLAPVQWSFPAVDTSVVDRAAEAAAGSARPLIVAGGGARGAAAQVRALAERLDAPVVTTANGKGILPEDHPLSLGSNVRFASVQEESRQADLLVVLGSELADSDLWGGRIGRNPDGADGNPDAQIVVRCDIDPDQLNKNLVGDVLAAADTRDFLDGLLAALPPRAKDTTSTDTTPGAHRAAGLRAGFGADFDDALIGARVTRLVQQAAGPEVVVAGDSSRVTYDGSVHALHAVRHDQLLYMPGFATLGYGIPAALGAKVAAPGRAVVAVLGDGAAMFSIQEIMTASELRLPIPFVIVDNGGYQEIEFQMTEREIDPYAVRLDRPDFAALGRAMGAAGVTIEEADLDTALPAAVSEALKADRPTVVHVRLRH